MLLLGSDHIWKWHQVMLHKLKVVRSIIRVCRGNSRSVDKLMSWILSKIDGVKMVLGCKPLVSPERCK